MFTNRDKSQDHYAERKKPDTEKYILYDGTFIYFYFLRLYFLY